MNNPLFEEMLYLVVEKFEGKVDLAGRPYIMHLLRVMADLNSDDEELNCIALGHDLIEDCYLSRYDGYYDLIGRGFTDRIASGISLLTKAKGDTYDIYIQRISLNPDAVLVKMADLRDNMDLSRFGEKYITDSDILRQRKYACAYEKLERVLNDKAKR